jgi:hypothetical protein
MQQYDFTGHLRPLPPGVKLPIELCGKVYLVTDVLDELKKRDDEIKRLQAGVRMLENANAALGKKIRAAKGKGANDEPR